MMSVLGGGKPQTGPLFSFFFFLYKCPHLTVFRLRETVLFSELNADEQNVNLGFMGFQGESEVGSHERSS